MTLDFRIDPLAKSHRRDNFDCGEPALNLFLQQFARQNASSGLSKTFVAVREGDLNVCGYYSVSTGAISFDIVPAKLPRYPIPTMHLGRLAVDLKMQGHRLGELLLFDALKRAVDAAELLGIYAVELYAISDTAKQFYLHYGFLPLIDDDLHIYLPLETVKKSALFSA